MLNSLLYFLEAVPRVHDDEREYVYPSNLKKELIPPVMIEFFDQVHDKTISDEKLFKSKVKFNIGDCPCVVGFGGIHGAIPTYLEEPSGTRVIVNFDVASLYPSLMIKCGYTSRNIPSPKLYEVVYYDRLAAKRTGDKKKANTFKLVLNTKYGAMLNQFNNLYDPLMGRSVCISGQLFLTELVVSYLRNCFSITIINFNTDGVMLSIEEEELPKIYAINKEWEERTQFQLEEEENQQSGTEGCK